MLKWLEELLNIGDNRKWNCDRPAPDTLEPDWPQLINKNKTIRGVRSNFISCECYDTQDEVWVFVEDLDMRKPLDRYIPVWIMDKIEKKIKGDK
jgi:hypothetical protein